MPIDEGQGSGVPRLLGSVHTCSSGDPRKPADQLLALVAQSGLVYLDAHPLVRELFEGKHNDALPKWARRLDELRVLGRQNVIEILRLGIAQGRFRASLDVDQVAKLLQDLQMSTFVFREQATNQGEPDLERRARAGLDLVLNGLLCRDE